MQEDQFIAINKSQAVQGSIAIQGSKNSALALVAAACLNDQLVTLNNVPDLRDFRLITQMLTKIGIITYREDDAFFIDAKMVTDYHLDKDITADFRASYYFIAPILQRFKKVSLSYPGGDDFGSRPIDQHLKGMRKLGARIEEQGDHYTVYADKLIGTEFHFEVITSGATINLMLLATLAHGNTTLTNCASDPEVVDVAKFLSLMGHRIIGAGTNKITIIPSQGHPKHPITYTAIPDRLIAGSFLMLPGILGGEVTITNAIPEHLNSLIFALKDMGLEITQSTAGLTSRKVKPLNGMRCVTGMYPLFATDLQQPLTALMLFAETDSSVQDNVYHNRFSHVEELAKMGIKLRREENIAYIDGKQYLNLQGEHDVNCRDVRAGMCLLFTALGTDGETRLHDVKHLFRGYENLVANLNKLGVNIELRSEVGV